MSKAEIYFPETMATQKKNSDGKIRFDLNFENDFNPAKNNTQNSFINNFATTTTTTTTRLKATKLYINSSDAFPSLRDSYGNYATQYLVISLNDSKTYIAIPICNKYKGNFNTYVNKEYLEKTLTRSMDKLLKIARSNIPDAKNLIDLNSTMNELKGTPKSYKKYTSKLNETDKADSEIYVIDKIIYIEPFIKTSFYEQIITKQIIKPPTTGTYKIANVTAECAPSGRSTAYKLFQGQDWGELVMYNIFMTVGYFIFIMTWYLSYMKYNYSDGWHLLWMFLLTIPFWVYFGLVREFRLKYRVDSARPWYIRNKKTKNRRIDQSINGYKTKQEAERALGAMNDKSLHEVYVVYLIRNQHGFEYKDAYKTQRDAEKKVESLNRISTKGARENDDLIKRTILSMCYSGIILSIPFLYGLYLLVMYLMTISFLAIPSMILKWLKDILFNAIYFTIKFRNWRYLMPLLKVLFILLNLGLVSWGIAELFDML